MKRKFAVTAALVVAAGAISGGAAIAAGGDDDATDSRITGSALDNATAAALRHTGGGTVTGTEVGDEESYYEVEVTLDAGRQVDVQLDKSFNVVASESDREDESGKDDATELTERASEVPGDDGPGGWADEPGNPNADTQQEGEH